MCPETLGFLGLCGVFALDSRADLRARTLDLWVHVVRPTSIVRGGEGGGAESVGPRRALSHGGSGVPLTRRDICGGRTSCHTPQLVDLRGKGVDLPKDRFRRHGKVEVTHTDPDPCRGYLVPCRFLWSMGIDQSC